MDECTREDIPVLIAIEGLIAAGKSSLIDYYTGLNVNRLPEPVHIWQDFANSNILHMRYNNPKRYAFCFQILADLTRLDQLQDVRYSKQVTLMERSLLSGNRIFAKLDMGYAEGKILNYWHSFLESNSKLKIHPDLFVYLRTDPEVAYQRCVQRGRTEERDLNLDFFKDLHHRHDKVFVEDRDHLPAPALVIDGNLPLSQMADAIMDIEVEIQLIRNRKRAESRDLENFMLDCEQSK